MEPDKPKRDVSTAAKMYLKNMISLEEWREREKLLEERKVRT